MHKRIKKYIQNNLQACELRKDDAAAYNNLGLSLFENQNYELALEKFSKTLDLDDSKASY